MIRGLRAQVAKHRLVRGLLLAARDGDADTAQLEQRHRAELETCAPVERARAGEAAVAECDHLEASGERRFARRSGACPEAEFDLRSPRPPHEHGPPPPDRR